MNKVLVIEDEEDILNLIKTILIGNGFEVFTATNGEEGLIKAVNTKPDLILLDVVMPGLSGLEVCRLLKNKKHFEDTPIIVMSVLDRDIDRKYVNEAGADMFFKKPFSVDELLLIVDSFLQ